MQICKLGGIAFSLVSPVTFVLPQSVTCTLICQLPLNPFPSTLPPDTAGPNRHSDPSRQRHPRRAKPGASRRHGAAPGRC